MTLKTNLDSGSEQTGPFDITNPTETSNYSTSTDLFDSLGNKHTATTYFVKTSPSTWEWHTVVNSSELTAGAAGANPLTEVGTGSLTFDNEGKLLTGGTATTNAGTLAWKNGSDTSQQISMNFNTTQFNSSSVSFPRIRTATPRRDNQGQYR